jgi:two-component system chemotaxis sensor kinase CheA
MPLNDDQILADFVVESRDHLAGIENQLLALEANGAGVDLELVNTLFRGIHSIKGAAGFLGLNSIGQLAHGLESVLNLVRNQQMVPDGAAVDILLRGADKLRGMIEDVEHSNEVDVLEHLGALQALVAGATANPKPAESPRPAASDASPSHETSAGEYATPQHDAHASGESKGSSSKPALAGSTPDSTIRVQVGVLDRLMNLAGELVLARNQLLQIVNSAEHRVLSSVGARLNQVTSELQETIMQTRLQAVGTVFSRFPRVVRDLSITLGKQCQLTVEGQEVEVDKSILEAISDPLTHLVRNAVDHGLESPDDRATAGKPAMGTVSLRAFHQAGKVNIVIRDDGRGIDIARLKEKAVARGLLSADHARTISDREAILLIFKPGFSTAEKVTAVSGRGVGMDVVKTNIERLGGTVSVETQIGRGTTVHVKLPLTLAIIPSLIVSCDGRRYAVPQASIRELVRIKASEVGKRIERVKRAKVFRLRGSLLPLVDLGGALNHTVRSESQGARPINILVVEAGHLRYGLMVDGLCDSEEIVVKPLGRHMKGCSCLAGATILGDGKVALILDIPGIASHSQLAAVDDESVAADAAADSGEETQPLLMFSNHPAEFFGVPMELVARIERIRADQIDSVGGQEILQYRGGSLPLLCMEHYLTCKSRAETDNVYVVVFTAAKREIGLLVPELLDIRSVPTRIDTETFREPGIIGSLVFEKRTIRLVDLHELACKAHSDWFQTPTVPELPAGSTPRILLAEDSDFFRKQLVGFLESEGYEVRACEDGAVAWEVIQDQSTSYDLVVTDVEMPRMTGLELARAIRGDNRLREIPIIAVTSLAGEDDMRRGQEVGVTDYHIKLDRERLAETVARLLRQSLGQVQYGRNA